MGQYQDACAYLERALQIKPDDHACHVNLGACHLKRNDRSAAKTHYQAALRLDPTDETSRYMLACLENKPNHAYNRAPQQYISALFDEYADKFDHHLVEHLKYQTPQLLMQQLRALNILVIPDQSQSILDLGCGTGIMGKMLKPFAQKLIGVDLSEKMLEQAQAKMTILS